MLGAQGRTQGDAPEGTRSSRVWTFGNCVLDERSLELKVDGAVATLDRKPLEVLFHLLRHAGEVVTKDELCEAVWPGRIITDSNLTKTIAVLRAALGEQGQSAIKTVHGYGYRLVAPVSVAMPEGDTGPARFDFAPGMSPPLRPLWQLTRRLGTGGQGEAWLAHHAKTREPRVFKFAEGGRALAALKREISLNRLLRTALPGNEAFLPLADWNLDEPPFFTESPYVEGGDLATWAQAQGGAAALPLERRLGLLAGIADAVADAHSVGVLHKDLKPGNVLVDGTPDDPRIRLVDFGSGALLDPEALEARGITRMGFTQVLPEGKDSSGTPLYLAPEVFAGQPFTVKSDVYALGVMLYQLVAGDLRKALAPGWEKGVPDPLLRADIAAAAAGDPADRLGDAAQLAQRLRELEPRRQAAEAERVRTEQAERATRLRGQLRQLRVAAVVLLAALGTAIGAGVYAFKARNEARESAATTTAVNEFLNRDLLASADPARGPVKDLTVRTMLDRAAGNVDQRFADRPVVAAEIHTTLGTAYSGIGEFKQARSQLETAAALFEQVEGPDGMGGFEPRRNLIGVLDALGARDDSCQLVRTLMETVIPRLPPLDEGSVGVQLQASRCRGRSGGPELDDAIADSRRLVAALEAGGMQASATYPSALRILASQLFDAHRHQEAAVAHRRVVAASEATYGAGHIQTIRHRAVLVGALASAGRLDEADAEMQRANADLVQWSGAGSGDAVYLAIWEGLLRTQQGRFEDAERLGRLCLTSPLGQQRGGSFRVSAQFVLGEALAELRPAEAIAPLREAIDRAIALRIAPRSYEIPGRSNLADALLKLGRVAEADEVMRQVKQADIAALRDEDWVLAQLRRTQGLLWFKQGHREEARAALKESFDRYRAIFGADFWRTKRVAAELAAAGS